MKIGGPGLRRHVLAALVAVGVARPAMAGAEEIRVFLAASRDEGVQAQVSKLERAIRESGGLLVMTESLSAAHVVVQFTEYRRSIGDKGKPLFRWAGQAKLLRQPEHMAVSATPLPERFELLLIGDDGIEEARALESLERMLSRTLRPLPTPPVKEDI